MKKLPIPALLVIAGFLTLTGFKSENGIVLPTSLKLTVLDYLGNVVDGAAVKLYLTEDDYREETNQVGQTTYSDKKGKVTIKNLEPRIYYVYVTKDDMNNIGRGVMTDTLKAGKVNKVNIVIE